MDVFKEFSKIVKRLEKGKMKYALVGGVAMAFHSEPRFTRDIDLLLDPDDLKAMRDILKKEGYFVSTSPWTFQKAGLTLHRFLKIKDEEEMIIDVLIPETDRYKEIILNAIEAESDEGKVRIATKKDLIWLKRIRNSKQDQVDIENLENEENR